MVPSAGTRLTWQGRPVSMVCFNWQTNKTLFMFVIDARAIPDAERIGEDVRLTPAHGITTVSWRRNGKIYLLAADTEAETLRKLLTGGAAKLGRSEFARITALQYSPWIEKPKRDAAQNKGRS